MNLGNSNVMVRNRDKTSRKNEDDALAKMLAGKCPPANHPFSRMNKTTQYETFSSNLAESSCKFVFTKA